MITTPATPTPSPFEVEAFDHYWAMWNEHDLDAVRSHLDRAVTEDFVFCDPIHFHVGRDALEKNVRELRTEHPLAEIRVRSGVDNHHNRYRYQWHFRLDDQILIKGLDIATVSDSGLIERIDGFFGPLPPDI